MRTVLGGILLAFLVGLTNSQLKYQEYGVELHNNFRAMHGAEPLQYGDTMSRLALLCAEYYSQINRIDHSCLYKTVHGENLARFRHRFGALNKFDSIKTAIEGWYDEVYDYNFQNPLLSTKGINIYHFTQMVWKSSWQIGIAAFRNLGENRTYVVALYEPKGNILDRGYDTYRWFKGNVTPVNYSPNYDYYNSNKK